jgi:S1-C subfamily serine protease
LRLMLSANLALLRASAGDREPILLSSRSQVDLGDGVVIVGYALAGGEALATNGIVNAQVGRSGEPELFQTSAAVVPESSGGPVLDTSGHLVGVVRLSAAGTSTGAGSVAVALPLVTAFLTEHGVYATLASDAPTLPTREIVTRALRAAIPIECWR